MYPNTDSLIEYPPISPEHLSVMEPFSGRLQSVRSSSFCSSTKNLLSH